MQYMFLIYNAEGKEPAPGTDAFDEMMQGYNAFTQEVRDAGIFREGAPLEKVDTATTVRVRNGSPSVVDGPFAETKEVLGGYYILECENLDQATALAAKIPTAAFGSIEVRPVMDM